LTESSQAETFLLASDRFQVRSSARNKGVDEICDLTRRCGRRRLLRRIRSTAAIAKLRSLLSLLLRLSGNCRYLRRDSLRDRTRFIREQRLEEVRTRADI